jgi:predicted DNA-binding WGR domain protein
MRVYFFFGRNEELKGGLSSKIWKIERRGRVVQAWWGRAKYDTTTRRLRPQFELLTKAWRFATAAQAIATMDARIDGKLKEGYQRSPRRRKRANAAK